MTARTAWVRADGKRPIQCNGRPASSTDPRTWARLSAVRASKAGNGIGIMLGDGLGCYDLDHCLHGNRLEPWAAEAVASISEPVLWVERSMSGSGLHLFVEAPAGPGSRRGGVERYTRERFIRVTGDRFTL